MTRLNTAASRAGTTFRAASPLTKSAAPERSRQTSVMGEPPHTTPARTRIPFLEMLVSHYGILVFCLPASAAASVTIRGIRRRSRPDIPAAAAADGPVADGRLSLAGLRPGQPAVATPPA